MNCKQPHRHQAYHAQGVCVACDNGVSVTREMGHLTPETVSAIDVVKHYRECRTGDVLRDRLDGQVYLLHDRDLDRGALHAERLYGGGQELTVVSLDEDGSVDTRRWEVLAEGPLRDSRDADRVRLLAFAMRRMPATASRERFKRAVVGFLSDPHGMNHHVLRVQHLLKWLALYIGD